MNREARFAQIIIDKMERGTIPWRKPWHEELARQWATSRPYSGLNQFFLEPGEYATAKQIEAAGGRVREGMRPSMVCFFKWNDTVDEQGKSFGYPVLRNHFIYEINSQCEGLQSNLSNHAEVLAPIASCEQIRKLFFALPGAPEIRHSTRSRAFYSRIEDFIHLPNPDLFENAESYYSTLFHEMIHATGHEKRMRRRGLTSKHKFGDEQYNKEELIAEIGAGILCNFAQINHKTIDNSVSYLASWLEVLKNDKHLIFLAYRHAEKAVRYILGDLYVPLTDWGATRTGGQEAMDVEQ